ncbi:MAG TPA: HAMP domain-containing sensor histidine kinase [Polyangia bacterium]|nr:HAMP domain-containing sensor histidine kinase [Polyangia bacterium]
MSGGIEDTLFGVLRARRELVVACWNTKIRAAVGASLSNAELLDRIPDFVDEIIAALYPDAIPLPSTSGNAEEHGAQRLRLHFDVAEVVREYGLLHECIIEIARDAGAEISLGEQQVISRWLNNGIADALAQYVKRRDQEQERQRSEHLGFIAHELRNPLSAARAALQRLRSQQLAAGGRAADLLERSLRRTADMIDNALSHASLALGVDPRLEPVVLSDMLHDIDLDAGIDAQDREVGLRFVIEGDAVIAADPRLLRSAVFNLVQNALKFSRAGSLVTVTARGASDRVTIDVADHCGGLPPGRVEDLFAPLVQRGENRTGFGLGLAIARQAVEAQGGTVAVHDMPGTGCVFTIQLPRSSGAGNPEPPARIES